MRAPSAWTIRHLNLSAVRLGDGIDESQPQPVACECGPFDKALQHVRAQCGRKAGTVILYDPARRCCPRS